MKEELSRKEYIMTVIPLLKIELKDFKMLLQYIHKKVQNQIEVQLLELMNL